MKRNVKLPGNDKGSSVVEAVIVLPIVILALISAILIVSYLTEAVFSSVDMKRHMAYEAGKETGTRNSYDIPGKKPEMSYGYKGGKKYKSGTENIRIKGGFLFSEDLKGDTEARVYVMDEKKTIRYKDLLEEIIY